MLKSFLVYLDLDGDFQEWNLQIPKAHSLLNPWVRHPDGAIWDTMHNESDCQGLERELSNQTNSF